MSTVSKKTPVTSGRKKVIASARMKTSVLKARTRTTGHNRSYLQQPVSTSEITIKYSVMSFTASLNKNDTILTLLQEMSKSNRVIVNHIASIEHQHP